MHTSCFSERSCDISQMQTPNTRQLQKRAMKDKYLYVDYEEKKTHQSWNLSQTLPSCQHNTYKTKKTRRISMLWYFMYTYLYVTMSASPNLSLMSEFSMALMRGLHRWSLLIWGYKVKRQAFSVTHIVLNFIPVYLPWNRSWKAGWPSLVYPTS